MMKIMVTMKDVRCHLMWYCWTQFLFLPFLFLPHPELFNCHILALSTFYSVIRTRRCNYQQHCAQCKALVFKLRPILRFLPSRGDTLHRWGWNLARRSGGPLLCAKFNPHWFNDKDPLNWNFYWDFVCSFVCSFQPGAHPTLTSSA